MVSVQPLEVSYKKGIFTILTRQGVVRAKILPDYAHIGKKLKVRFV
jgi:hypothetical protein